MAAAVRVNLQSLGMQLKKVYIPLSMVALLLTGCGSPAQSAPAAPSVAAATEAPSSSTTPSAASNQSARGNIVKKLGEGAGFNGDDGKEAVSFTVNKITVDVPCTEKYAQAPQNGHFIALDVSIKTNANLATTTGSGKFSMSSSDWKAIAPNGTTFNGYLSGHSYGCLADSTQVPMSIGPGENVTGTVLLDVPTTEGTLIFKPIYLKAGWEWQYPAK
jgi:hypothetical protein